MDQTSLAPSARPPARPPAPPPAPPPHEVRARSILPHCWLLDWWDALGLRPRIALLSGGLVGGLAIAIAFGWYWALQDAAGESRERRAAIAEMLVRQDIDTQAEILLRTGILLAATDADIARVRPLLSRVRLPGTTTMIEVVGDDALPAGSVARAAIAAGTATVGLESARQRIEVVAAVPLPGQATALRLSETIRPAALVAGAHPVLRFAVHVAADDGTLTPGAASDGWVPVMPVDKLRTALDGAHKPIDRLAETIPATVTAFALRDVTGRPIGVVEAILSVTRLSEYTATNVASVAMAVALTAALAAAVGLTACQFLLSPLRAIAQAASAMADGRSDVAVPGTERTDDVGNLARAVVRNQHAMREQRLVFATLREQEARLRELAEAMPLIVTMRDRHGRMTFSNARLATTIGADPTDPVIHDWADHVHPDDRVRLLAAWRQAIRTGSGFQIECRLRVPGGVERWHAGEATPVRGKDGEVDWWVGTVTDVDAARRHTDELAAREKALRIQVELLNTITATIQDAIFRCDAQGRVVWTNPAADAMFAGPRGNCVGRKLPELVRPYALAGAPAWDAGNPIATACADGVPLLGHSSTLLRHDGTRLDAVCSCMPILVDGLWDGAVVVVQNVTEYRQTEAERIALLGRLVAAQEAERLRIARDLHDGMGQDLTALIFGLASLERITENPSHRAMLRDLRGLADAVGASAHRAAWETRPTSMEDIGLIRSLETHVEDWGHRFGIRTDFQANANPAVRLPADVETAVFRVAQEALTNVARHAHATTTSVVIAHRGRGLVLIIEDDGQGFDAERVDRSRLGLAGMRERLALIDGTLTIESRRGAGTTIFARVILPPDDDPEWDGGFGEVT